MNNEHTLLTPKNIFILDDLIKPKTIRELRKSKINLMKSPIFLRRSDIEGLWPRLERTRWHEDDE